MKTIPAVVAALAFGVTGARAATIYTPPVLHEGSSTSFCNVANVSSQAREITVTIFDDDGTAVLGPTPFNVAPGAVVSPGSSTSGRRYCRVTVQGGKRTVLVTYHTFAGGQTQSVVRGF